MRRVDGVVVAVVGSILGWSASLAGQIPSAAPEVRLRSSAEELLAIAYPERYGAHPDALVEDVEWAEDEGADLREWWQRQGPMVLLRAADMAGLSWPYRDIEVYLVRYWPQVSIAYPLLRALDAVQAAGGSAQVPPDEDVRVLLLAHQLVHVDHRAARREQPALRLGGDDQLRLGVADDVGDLALPIQDVDRDQH
jgi:hypothetical protein